MHGVWLVAACCLGLVAAQAPIEGDGVLNNVVAVPTSVDTAAVSSKQEDHTALQPHTGLPPVIVPGSATGTQAIYQVPGVGVYPSEVPESVKREGKGSEGQSSLLEVGEVGVGEAEQAGTHGQGPGEHGAGEGGEHGGQDKKTDDPAMKHFGPRAVEKPEDSRPQLVPGRANPPFAVLRMSTPNILTPLHENTYNTFRGDSPQQYLASDPKLVHPQWFPSQKPAPEPNLAAPISGNEARFVEVEASAGPPKVKKSPEGPPCMEGYHLVAVSDGQPKCVPKPVHPRGYIEAPYFNHKVWDPTNPGYNPLMPDVQAPGLQGMAPAVAVVGMPFMRFREARCEGCTFAEEPAEEE